MEQYLKQELRLSGQWMASTEYLEARQVWAWPSGASLCQCIFASALSQCRESGTSLLTNVCAVRLHSSRSSSPCAVGSGQRYMICVTHFCTLHESNNTRPCENHISFTRPCENHTCFACDSRIGVCCLTRATYKNVRQNLTPLATA